MYQTWSKRQIAQSHTLIRRGSLRHVLNSRQRELYDFIKSDGVTEAAVYAGRKFGKSFTLCVIGVERCLTEPGAVVKHCFPTSVLATEVMEPLMEEVLNLFPAELRPKKLISKSKWVFNNGSEYKLVGVHPDNIKAGSARGPFATMLLGDEVAFWHAGSYSMTLLSSLLPQQTLVPNPKRIYATTPPEQVDHPFIIDTVPPIRAKGGFFHYTVYDNPMLTPERIEQLKEECGGEQSNAWRREYMAEIVAPIDRLVVPEFSDDLVVDDAYLTKLGGVDRFGYLSADLGVVDHTGVLSAVYVPSENTVVVVKEETYKGEGLGRFAQAWADHDVFLRSNYGILDKTQGVVDCFEQARMSLIKDFGLDFRRPTKRKLSDNVGYTRMHIQNKRVLVHESCHELIAQLKTGLWKENNGKEATLEFDRTEVHGHLDLIAALVYLVRVVPWGRSPRDSTNTPFDMRSR